MPITLFAADSGDGDVELWATDGETGRTQRLVDIDPGPDGGMVGNIALHNTVPLPLAVLNGYAYFLGTNGVDGLELWRSGGNAATTEEVTDLPNGSVSPVNIVVANNQLFYVGYGAAGPGIYKTSGTPGVTPTFIAPVSPSINITKMFGNGNTLYWTQSDQSSAGGLYATTGNGVVQHLVVDTTGDAQAFTAGGQVFLYYTSGTFARVSSGGAVTPISNVVGTVEGWSAASNGTLFFATRVTGNDHYLFALPSGATTATVLQTFQPFDSLISGNTSMATIGNNLVFTTYDMSHGAALWVSDGTQSGTVMIKDPVPEASSTGYGPFGLVAANGTVFFQVFNIDRGIELWKTDGTTGGTSLVKLIETAQPDAGGGADILTNMTSTGGLLYFGANDRLHGQELWRSDGTPDGTYQVLDINPTTISKSVTSTTNFEAVSYQGHAYFFGADINHGVELWSSDGTAAGSQLLKDISPGVLNSDPQNLVVSGQSLFFQADDGVHGGELWVSDGTAANTHMVADIFAGEHGGGAAGMFAAFGNSVLFFANDLTHGTEAWVSDGSPEGTMMLADAEPGQLSGIQTATAQFFRAGHSIIYLANTPQTGIEPWVTDGTPAGTHLLKDIAPGTTSSSASLVSTTSSQNESPAAQLGVRLFFAADDGSHGNELWITDGTASGTTLLKDINPTGDSDPGNFTVVGNTLYFTANDGSSIDPQLFKTDGTAQGTVALTATNWNTIGSGPNLLTAVGSNLFFVGSTAAAGRELYVTNGGLVSLFDINPGSSGSNPGFRASMGQNVFFAATDATHGNELWASDGTLSGTHMVADINPGAASSSIGNAVVLNNQLYFSATDGQHGIELWTSDGTAAGTNMVIDIAPGSGNSLTNSVLQVAGNMLVFQASDGVHVTQDWVSDGTAAGTHMVTDNTKPMDSNPFGFVSLIALIGNTAETLTGTHDDDHIDGGGGDDVLAGKGGDDIFTGGGGNDTIDGGAGHDTIVYSGNITDYVVTTDPSGNLVVADQRVNAPDGTDTLMSVETLQFNNGSITYDLNGAANWSTITTLLDAAGSTGGVYVTLDGGDSWATTYDVFQQSPVMWATAHIGADQKPILTVTTNDDGTHSLRVFDHDNVYSWASFTVGYDANWNQTSFSGTNDDSSTNLTIGQVADALDSALWFTTPYDPYFEQQPFNLTLTGGGDTDILFGRAADDTINGGGGADQIWGGRGDDTLTGGSGLDVFHFAPGDGNDTITDFSALFGGNDRIDLHGFGFTSYSDLTPLMSSSGNDVLITFDARDHILIQGVGNTLNASDFIFT